MKNLNSMKGQLSRDEMRVVSGGLLDGKAYCNDGTSFRVTNCELAHVACRNHGNYRICVGGPE